MAVISAIRNAFNMDQTVSTPTLPKEWPITTADKNRIEEYKTFRSIWNGAHALALDEQDIAGRYGQYVAVNIPRIIVTIPADFLFGEEFELTFPEDTPDELQEQIQEMVERNDMRTMLYESKLDSGVDGECVILVDLVNDEKEGKNLARFRPQPVGDWCPENNPDDIREVTAHWIGWKRTAIVDKKEKDFLRLIKHEKGKILNYVVGINSDGSLQPDSEEGWNALYPDTATRPPKSIDTGLDDFALDHVPNWRTAKDYHGISEYRDTMGMFASLNARVTQSDAVMARHSDPMLGLPHEVFAAMKAQGAQIDKALLDVVQMGPNGEKPEYTTWDGKLADNLAYIDKLITLIALVSETAPQLLNQGEWGGDLSGKALKILLIRTLAKVNRSRLYYSVAIPNLLVKAQILEGVSKPVRPTIKWPDGLPQDIMEAIEVAERKLAARIESRVGASMMVDDINEEAAKEKIAEVDAEEDTDRNNDAVANAVMGGNGGIQRPNPIQVKVGA